ncbi:MAG: tellurium resistance protein [Rhodobacter sp.]|nr:tellurium resistance protein [Rhodobacter sp.]
MVQDRARYRPKQYPPPEFPPRRVARFAKTPPAVFPAILGAIGLVLALRRGLAALDLPQAVADLLAGLVLMLWLFAAFAYAVKLARRPGVLWEDLRVLPGRAGLAACTAGGLAVAALLVPHAPDAARIVLFGGLALHAALALAILRILAGMPAEARGVNPVWHLTFVGFIIGGLSAAPLGHEALARWLLWGTLPVAGVIWGISLAQLLRRVPPAPLRPLLAIHLAPAALFSTVAGLTGQATLAMVFAGLALALLLVMLAAGRWIAEAGFTPLWGAFTFPLTALASALLASDAAFIWTGIAVLVTALGFVPFVLWRVMRLWPGGKLAARTNAAEA